MARKHVNVGIVGVGYWGKNLLRTFAQQAKARVLELCDLDQGLLAKYRDEYPGVRTTTSFDEIIHRDDLDAIVLATPPSRHHAMALPALEACKHVWVEKPLALTLAHGRELVKAAQAAERTLFVDETFLYDPLVREMKHLIDAGHLGDLYHLSFERLGMGRIKRDSNVWWNSAPHDLSILFHLVPRALKQMRFHEHCYLQKGIADMIVADLELEGGVSAHIYLNWLYPEKTAKVVVTGTQRMLSFEGRFEKRALTLHDYNVDLSTNGNGSGDTSVVPITSFTSRRLEVPAAAEPLALAAEHFLDCILNRQEPVSSGARSLRVVEALEAAEHVATHGGRFV